MYLGEYDKAEPLLKQGLEVYQKTLGPKHPQSMTCLSNLAYTCQQLGKLDEAITLQLQILELDQQILPPGDPELALCLSHTSSIYIARNDYVKALAFEQQALEIFRASIPNSDNCKVCLSNVGWLFQQIAFQTQARQDFAAARQAFGKAIEIYVDLYGKDHWRVVDLRLQLRYAEELAKMTADQRRELAEAHALYEKASPLITRKPAEALVPIEQVWAIQRKLLGEEHWISVSTAMDAGFLYKNLGNFAKAEPLYNALPELVRKARGDLHPTYITAVQNLANLDEALDKYQESEALYLKALDLARKLDGGNNESVATILGNLASLYVSTSRYDKAEVMFHDALAKRKDTVGPRSSDYADDLIRLASFYMFNVRDHVKAEPRIREAIEIYKASLGDQDPRYARGINYLGTYYVRAKQFDLAEPLYQQALAIRKRTFGENHSEYGATLNNLAVLYNLQGDYARAGALGGSVSGNPAKAQSKYDRHGFRHGQSGRGVYEGRQIRPG